MNRVPFLFLGILGTLALSFWVLIFVPQTQIGQQQSTNTLDTAELYPAPRAGLAKRGADVYRAEGCMECHTEQVRPPQLGSDYKRGWGVRFTVAQDYLGDYPVMLGNQRIGPDLTNIGLRKPDRLWHLQHLYNPQALMPASMMPRYRYLFEKRRIIHSRSENAIEVPGVPAGFEVVPSDRAEALVEYLLSLRAQAELFEAPIARPPGAKTNAPPAAAATNATNNASTTAPPTTPVK
jgi:cytochrome c oxidase cbb3-type subunit 2